MPKLTRRTVLLIALAVVVASLMPTVAFAISLTGPQTVTGAKPAIVLKTGNLGRVLATPTRFGIYYWTVERKAGGRIRCTGQCAVAWPPVYVRGTVQKHVKGIAANFGTIKRGTKRQLTINGLPAYTYHHDPAGVVLCDDVNGWFAVRPL